MTPHKCPVCDGTGLVSRPPGIAGDLDSWTDTRTGPFPCQPCNGTGVLWSSPPAPPMALPPVCSCGSTAGPCAIHGGSWCYDGRL